MSVEARPLALSLGARGSTVVLAALDLLPIGLLAVAATVRPARLPVLGFLLLGAVVAARGDRRRLPAWAGTLPIGLSLAWGLIDLPAGAFDGSSCASPLSPLATYRAIEAVGVLAVTAALARVLGSTRAELGLRRPGRRALVLGLGIFVLAGPIGIVAGPTLAAPFFGPVSLATSDLAALVPALVFAVSNGTMEEVTYRGSLGAWSARTVGAWPAIVAQATVFGLAHTGPDFTGPPLLLAIVMATGGVLAGLIAWRTRSLFIPMAVHVALDIGLYYGNACRLG